MNGEVWRSWTVEREGMRVVIKVQDPEKVLLGFCWCFVLRWKRLLHFFVNGVIITPSSVVLHIESVAHTCWISILICRMFPLLLLVLTLSLDCYSGLLLRHPPPPGSSFPLFHIFFAANILIMFPSSVIFPLYVKSLVWDRHWTLVHETWLWISVYNL